jgi:signal peptidase I
MANDDKETKAAKPKHIAREYTEALVIAIILALIIRAFVIQAFKIPSSSMEPTLLIGDHLLVNKFIYGVKVPFIDKKVLQFKKPERGDIIVFKFPEDTTIDFIKRVIAVEGDTVELLKKQVLVNGKPIVDPYAVYLDGDESVERYPDDPKNNFGPVVVPENNVFCLGDNRDRSQDSRYWGFVDLNLVRGKALILYFSWDKTADSILKKVRWPRFGKLLHE